MPPLAVRRRLAEQAAAQADADEVRCRKFGCGPKKLRSHRACSSLGDICKSQRAVCGSGCCVKRLPHRRYVIANPAPTLDSSPLRAQPRVPPPRFACIGPPAITFAQSTRVPCGQFEPLPPRNNPCLACVLQNPSAQPCPPSPSSAPTTQVASELSDDELPDQKSLASSIAALLLVLPALVGS